MKQTRSSVIKLNIRVNNKPNSVTIRKDIVALWILMLELDIKGDEIQEALLNFVLNQCLPRWKKNYAKGLGEFINMCLLRSFLDRTDFYEWRKIYFRL